MKNFQTFLCVQFKRFFPFQEPPPKSAIPNYATFSILFHFKKDILYMCMCSMSHIVSDLKPFQKISYNV